MFAKIKTLHCSIFYTIIIIASILILGKVAQFGFFNSWDDSLHISGNYWITANSLVESLRYFWTHIHKGLFMPLTYTVWKLVWLAVEPLEQAQKASVYHILCLLFHTINCCLVFKIFTKLNFSNVSSVFGALIFLLHPVQVESFAWISEFKGLFAFFWCAMSVNQFLNCKNKSEIIPYFLSILFYIFALLCKPSSVPLPFVFAFLMLFKNGFTFNRYKNLIPFFVLAFIFALITRFSQPSSLNYYADLPIYCRIFIPLHTLGFYLSQLIIPAPLVSVYPNQLPADVMANMGKQFYWLLGFLAIILPIRYKSFRWIWLFELLLLPNSGIVPFDYQRFAVVADRYQYLAMPAAIFGLLSILGKFNAVKSIIITIIIIIFAIMTSLRTNDWRNSGTLHYSALKYNTNSPSLYVNLSEYLFNTGQFDLMENLFELADSNKIEYDLLKINKAVYCVVTEQPDSAIAIYREIISQYLDEDGKLNTSKSRTDLVSATMNYGKLMYSLNDYNESILSYNVTKQFAKMDIGDYGDYIKALNALSIAYAARSMSDSLKQNGDLDSAKNFSAEVLSIDKNNADALKITEFIENYMLTAQKMENSNSLDSILSR